MRPLIHFFFSLILAALLYPIFNWKVLLILAGSVLIDIDHYFWWICKYKKFNLIKAYTFFMRNMEANDFTNVDGILIIFHTIEFLLIMIVLSFYFEYALAFTIGLIFHYFLDLIFLYFVPKHFIANHSIIYWLLKHQIQKV